LREAFDAVAFGCFDVDGWHVRGEPEPSNSRVQVMDFPPGSPRFVLPGGTAEVVDPLASRLLSSQTIQQHFPQLASDAAELGFSMIDPLLFDGSLAIALRDGGPYRGIPAPDALRLASSFREDLVGTRFDDLLVLTGAGWSEWFRGLYWDHGWIIIDTQAARTYLLCLTGED
jgi:hypothetical protein